MVASETEAHTVSKWTACILLECFLVANLTAVGTSAVPDPGFPRGGANFKGGVNLYENERNWTERAHACWHPPLGSAIAKPKSFGLKCSRLFLASSIFSLESGVGLKKFSRRDESRGRTLIWQNIKAKKSTKFSKRSTFLGK